MSVACEPADYTQHRGMELDVSNKSIKRIRSQILPQTAQNLRQEQMYKQALADTVTSSHSAAAKLASSGTPTQTLEALISSGTAIRDAYSNALDKAFASGAFDDAEKLLEELFDPATLLKQHSSLVKSFLPAPLVQMPATTSDVAALVMEADAACWPADTSDTTRFTMFANASASLKVLYKFSLLPPQAQSEEALACFDRVMEFVTDVLASIDFAALLADAKDAIDAIDGALAEDASGDLSLPRRASVLMGQVGDKEMSGLASIVATLEAASDVSAAAQLTAHLTAWRAAPSVAPAALTISPSPDAAAIATMLTRFKKSAHALGAALIAVRVEMEKEAKEWHDEFDRAAKSQLSTIKNDEALQAAMKEEKLQIVHRAWSDISRTKGSCFGSNITDMTFSAISPETLRMVNDGDTEDAAISSYRDLPAPHFANFAALRKGNFSDEVCLSTPEAVRFTARTSDGSTTSNLSLAEFLRNIGHFVAELPDDADWSDAIDSDGSPMQLASQFSLLPLSRLDLTAGGAAAAAELEAAGADDVSDASVSEAFQIAAVVQDVLPGGKSGLQELQQMFSYGDTTKVPETLELITSLMIAAGYPRLGATLTENPAPLLDVLVNGRNGEAPETLGPLQPVDLSVVTFGYQANNLHIIVACVRVRLNATPLFSPCSLSLLLSFLQLKRRFGALQRAPILRPAHLHARPRRSLRAPLDAPRPR